VVLCLGVAIGSTALATDGTPPSTDTTDPTDPAVADEVVLADAGIDALQGEAAVQELVDTGTLDEVADDHDMDADELVDELRADSSLFLTSGGELGYVDTFPLDAPEPTPTGPVALTSGLDVSMLSSRPLSPRTLYLDFDGHETNDLLWADAGATLPWVSAPFDTDGNPGSLSAAEQAVIAEVWQRVSEDFAPFDVNVTTTDPGVHPQSARQHQDHRRSRVARGGPHTRAEPRHLLRPGLLRRSRILGADHGSRHLSDDTRDAVVEGRVHRRNTVPGRPCDHRRVHPLPP
jgi:hypothetical protein